MSDQYTTIKNQIDDGIQFLQNQSDTIILSFSCGKDSLAAWLFLRPHFKNIVPVYEYLIPDLDFVDKSIKMYENFFETKIIQLPHPSLYRMLNNLVFQPPEHCRAIEDAMLCNFDYEDVRLVVCQDNGLPENTYMAVGVRAVDSPMRWAAIKKYGVINHKQHKFYPVANLKKKEVFDLIEKHHCPLPEDYKLFNRSFDGIDYRFLKPIKDNYPDDYDKILQWFPLADLEIFRKELFVNGN